MVALLAGLAAWLYYLNEGLVLAHYDAKAHLVVARRVIDSLTPGWRQIGAVWLPLPHLLQIVPTQIDLFCRWLKQRGLKVAQCRDPGSTPLGERIRSLLLAHDPTTSIHRRSEMLLYMAARGSGRWSVDGMRRGTTAAPARR